MNLNAYDEISPKIDKQKTWIDVRKHLILSREIKYRQYISVSKRYNPTDHCYDYYIIVLDDKPDDRSFTRTRRDDYGRIKIRVNHIWQESSLRYFEKDTNISIELVEQADDGDIYKLNM